MIPEPPRRHRFEACTARFRNQIERTRSYLDTIVPAIVARPEHATANRQYCFQTIVLMLHTFVEEHYRSLISQAIIWRSDDVRHYLAKRRPDQAEQIEEMNAFRLMKVARKEVNFRDDGRKLKSIFTLLFRVGPFADAEAEAQCLEFVRVRNIITHQGGLVEDEDLTQLKTPEVVLRREVVGQFVIHHLDIQPAFFTSVLRALGRSIDAIDDSLKQDPRYSL